MSVVLVPPPLIGGGFALINQQCLAVTDRDFLGAPLVVFFGFSHCRVVCPRALQQLSGALDRLAELGKDVQGLYITVDPERDTPARLSAFLSKWPRFQGLTGSPDQVAKVQAAYRVYAERRDTADGYDMPHSAVAHLVDPAGRHIDHWQADLSVEAIFERIWRAL